MRSLTFVVVTCVATATALSISCDRQTLTRPTPIQQPGQTPPLETNLTGQWRGAMGLFSYYSSGDPALVLLNHSGSSLEGVLYCGGYCSHSGMRLSGTVDGHRIQMHGEGPAGRCTLLASLHDTNELQGTYDCATDGGSVQLNRLASPVEPPSCIPELLEPFPGAEQDNGRTDFRDLLDWRFDWHDCPGAEEYGVRWRGPNAALSSHYSTHESSFHFANCGYVLDRNRLGWTIWIRARIGAFWGPWSQARTFDVERVDSDPMSPACPASAR
jgi:hypothetical protein